MISVVALSNQCLISPPQELAETSLSATVKETLIFNELHFPIAL